MRRAPLHSAFSAAALTLPLVLAAAACGGKAAPEASSTPGGNGATGDFTPSPPAPQHVLGRVTAAELDAPSAAADGYAGEPLAGVRVSVAGGPETTTNERGEYLLGPVAPGARVIVRFAKDGYVPTWLPVAVTRDAGPATLEAALVPLTATTLDAAAGGEVGMGATRVRVPAGAFVDRAGQPVTGSVEVSLTPVPPRKAGIRAVPGDFRGEAPDGELALLQSYLMVDLYAEQDGERVYFAESVSLSVDVAAAGVDLGGLDLTRSRQIPLWAFESQSGLWVIVNYARVKWPADHEGPVIEVEIPAMDVNELGEWAVKCARDMACLDDSSGVERVRQPIIGGATGHDASVVNLSAGQLRAIGSLYRWVGKDKDGNDLGSFTCTATLVADRIVLTAAHCVVENNGDPQPPTNFWFVIGEGSSSHLRWLRVQDFEADTRYFTSCPDCNARYDVAMLVLRDSALAAARAGGFDLEPIAVDLADAGPLEGTTAQLVGYGVNTTGGIADRFWLTSRIDDVNGEDVAFDFSDDNTHGICPGDSGSPLLVTRDGAIRTIGALSWGNIECPKRSNSGHYARTDLNAQLVRRYLEGGQPGGPPTPPTPPPVWRQGPAPRWFNLDMFGTPTGLQGDVVDAAGQPLGGAYVSFWTLDSPDGHTWTHTQFGERAGHFFMHPVDANRRIAISAAVSLDPARPTPSRDDKNIAYNGIPELMTPGPIGPENPAAFATITPNPIVIAACRPGGDVFVTHVADASSGAGSVGAFFYQHGSLYEPCVPSGVLGELDRCVPFRVDPATVREGDPTPPKRGARSAGERLEVEAADGTKVVLREVVSKDGISYAPENLDAADVKRLFGATVTVRASGSAEGIGAFEQGGVEIPGAFELSGELDGRRTPTLGGALDVRWKQPAGAGRRMGLLLTPADPAATRVYCAMADDGSFRVPAAMIDELDRGTIDVQVYRSDSVYVPVAGGASVRVTGFYSVRADAVK